MSRSVARRCLVLVPTQNDKSELRRIVDEINALGERFTPLVVDDGSIEPVADIGLAHCLQIRLPANFGLGVCMHVAFDHALSHGYDAVIRVDSDGQHPVDQIPNFVELLEGGVDVVVGARLNSYEGGGARAVASRVAKAYLWLLARLIVRRPPSDLTTGFIAMNLGAVKTLNRFSFERYPEAQLIVVATRNGLRVSELAIEQIPRHSGKSTIGPFRALQIIYRFTLFVFGELLGSARGG